MDRVKLSVQIDNALDLMLAVQSHLSTRDVTDLKWRFSVEDFVESADTLRDYVQVSFKEAEERKRSGVRLEFTKRFTNKVERIAALEPAITHGWLGFNERLSVDYIKQMSLFPTADFMDGPDATEGACQLRVTEFNSVRQTRRDSNRKRTQEFGVKL